MENTNAQVNPAPEKKKSKKKWIIIAVVAVLIVAALGSSGESDTSGTTIENLSQSASDNNTSSDAQTATSANQSNVINVGNAVSDRQLKISYKSCDTDFQDYSEYADVRDGYKIIQAVFDFENISSNDISLNSIDCYADGVKCENFYSVDDYSSPTLQTISAGRKLVNATVYFEVPEDAKEIELEYEADFWNDEKYIFIVE